MPVDYLQGKVYSLRSHQTDQVYYGSTTQMLAKRLYEHKQVFKRYSAQTGRPYITSFEIVKHSDCYIELVENYPCASKAELEQREGEVIRAATDSVNKRIPGRTQAEYKQDNKHKQSAQQKLYYEANKDTISAYQKQYRESNKDTLSAQAAQKTTCQICNSIVCKGSLSGHKKSKRCQSFQLAAQSPLS
jgi:hypothetical protein